MNATLLTFAVEAGVKLGAKINAALIDAAVERPLLLPVGDLYADIDFNRARRFFDRPENSELIRGPRSNAPAGPYHDATNEELVLAFKTIRSINERLQPGGDVGDAVEIVSQLHAFEQYKDSQSAPVRRILGTLVEIGIDYFAAHPEAMGRDSSAKKIVHAFVTELRETDFAEGRPRAIVGDMLGAALSTLDANITLVDDDARLRVLLGAMNDGLMEAIDSVSGQMAMEDLFQRIGSSLLLGAAGAFTENIDLFMRDDARVRPLVRSTLTQILAGIKGDEDLFTNESLELIYKSALRAAGENADIFATEPYIQELISQILTTTASTQGRRLFSRDTAGGIVATALDVLAENVETLIDPSDPRRQLLADVVGAIAQSLANRSLVGQGAARELLSKQQLGALLRLAFNEVAKHPAQLIGIHADDPKRMVVAQAIGSIARSLGENPGQFVNGDGFVRLVEMTLEVVTLNASKLIDDESASTTKNLIFQVLLQIVDAVREGLDERQLVSRDVFLEIVARILPLASANLELLLEKKDLVEKTIHKVLALANDALENRTNGANLPYLIETILGQVLWGELNLGEETAVELAALEALRSAA